MVQIDAEVKIAAPKFIRDLLFIAARTQTGAIVACAYDVLRDDTPRFEGKATRTSDGYLLCDYVDKQGREHYSAFVGSEEHLWENINVLSEACHLAINQDTDLKRKVADWIR
jgi:hypothetical protein